MPVRTPAHASASTQTPKASAGKRRAISFLFLRDIKILHQIFGAPLAQMQEQFVNQIDDAVDSVRVLIVLDLEGYGNETSPVRTGNLGAFAVHPTVFG